MGERDKMESFTHWLIRSIAIYRVITLESNGEESNMRKFLWRKGGKTE